MFASKMSIARAFVLGALATGVVANAPMSEHEHTETALPQEIGTMTSDGLLIYSMNHCIITQTTNCEVSLSTGPPAAETPGDDASSGVASEGTTVTNIPGVPSGDYPVPTGQPGEPGEGEPTDGGEPGVPGEPTDGEPGETLEPTEGGETTPTNATGSPSNTGETTASETGDDEPSPTEGDDGATETETAATGTATAGSSITTVLEARVLGVAGLLAACLF